MWYKFTASGRETLYGWTEDKAVAKAAKLHLDRLDRQQGRDVDLYAMECIGVGDENDGDGRDAMFDDNTTVEDYEALEEERRRDREAAEREFHLQWGFDIWRMWLAHMVDGCSPAALAAALEYASHKGYCQPGDPSETVPADAKDASLQVRARSLYRHLLTLHPEDREEGLAIARAIVATPASWQRLESRDLTVRDCIYAARAEGSGQ